MTKKEEIEKQIEEEEMKEAKFMIPFILISICVAVIFAFITTPLAVEATKVKKSVEWEEWVKGTITSVNYFGCNNRIWKNVVFDNKYVRAFRNESCDYSDNMYIGDTGIIFEKSNGDLRWERTKKKKTKSKPKPIVKNISPPQKKYIWIDPDRKLPIINKVVLVRLNDGIVTTAYVNMTKEWKIELFKNKILGGETITKQVKEWKEVDLD
jgi:hypothetical protein